MTTQERYEFVGYAKSLFAQSKWTDDQWEAFADALMGYPAAVAREAVKTHFQTTRFTTPTTGAVVNVAKEIRWGETASPDGPAAKARTPDDVVGELRWTWSAAVRMYGIDRAIRQFASSDATRHVPELRKLGWTQDQIDVVIQEITGGEVTDSFRDHQRRLRDTWDDRVGVVVNRGVGKHSSRPLGRDLSLGLRKSTTRNRTVELPGDCAAPAVSQPQLGVLRGEREDQDDNDLPAGTYIDISDEDIPF